MDRTRWNSRVVLIVIVLPAALYMLSGKGLSSMASAVSAGGAQVGKPQIDDMVPDNLKTATFAMG